MPQNNLNLTELFATVTQELVSNQQSLNQADSYNQDHGDNMVQTFQTITKALQRKKSSSPSAALSYAAKVLSKDTTSSSGKLYAQNLTQAATQFKGKSIDTQGALSLLQTLIGSGQPDQSANQPAGGDILGTLLGGLSGNEGPAAQSSSPAGGGDLFSMLLGGLSGNTEPASQQSSQQLGGGDLLGTLLGNLTGGGGNGLGSLVQTFLGGSGMGNDPHRNQSTQMVINAFLQALNSSGSQQ